MNPVFFTLNTLHENFYVKVEDEEIKEITFDSFTESTNSFKPTQRITGSSVGLVQYAERKKAFHVEVRDRDLTPQYHRDWHTSIYDSPDGFKSFAEAYDAMVMIIGNHEDNLYRVTEV